MNKDQSRNQNLYDSLLFRKGKIDMTKGEFDVKEDPCVAGVFPDICIFRYMNVSRTSNHTSFALLLSFCIEFEYLIVSMFMPTLYISYVNVIMDNNKIIEQ